MNKYYAVTAKCGHVGRHYYVSIVFAVYAENAREAASYTKTLPRVKRDAKYCIENVEEISQEEYKKLSNNNRKDPYFNSSNIQEQNILCPEVFLLRKKLEDFEKIKTINKKEKSDLYKKKEKNRLNNLKDYLKDYQYSY